MWDRLKQADIEQAKLQLDLRRNATLQKHAEEMQILAADQAAIETLNHLANAFSRKFKKLHALPNSETAPVASTALVTTIKPSAPIKPATTVKPAITVKPAMTIKPNEHRVPHRHSDDKRAPKVRHPDRRGHRTNFETYVHAMVKNERGW
jgi:hypothetical protein